MAAPATIHTQRSNDGTVVVEVHGEVDLGCADRLRRVLVDAANQLRPVRIVVDLRHVTFIDSTGIGALVAGTNTARSIGVGFVVRNPSAFVVTQLRQTGLHQTLIPGG
jgi:anti-sigma B factor antagonist